MSTQVSRTQYLTQQNFIYQLLARVFRTEVDAEFLTQLASEETLSLLKEFCPELKTEALQVVGADRIDDLQVEFCRLFIGPGPFVAPYESVNRTEGGNEGQHWGDATVEIKCLLESLGLNFADNFHEMPDHISVEFELMSRLLVAEVEAIQLDDGETNNTSLEVQEHLINKHIGVWVPGFCDKLIAISQEPFYVEFAVLTRSLIQSHDYNHITKNEREEK